MVKMGGDFVKSGSVEREMISECLFENISVKGDDKESRSEMCDVEGTIMKDVERGIYGGIVSGLNEKRGKDSSHTKGDGG